MKKILLMLIGVLTYTYISAQTTCDEKGIITNPQAPVNNEKTSAKNYFEWMLPAASPNFTCYPSGYPSYPILSPWHVSDPNFNYLNLANGTNSDYKYEDGWELLKVNLGKFLDNTTSRQRTVKIPYVLLYNRYQGVVRMFASLRDQSYSYQTVVVKFSQPKGNLVGGQPSLKASAILSLHGETAQSLDQTSTLNTVRIPTYFPNNENYFFWVDLPVAYDPCVCKYPGQIDVGFEFYSQADIEMQGVVNGTWKTITQTDPNQQAITIAKNLIVGVGSLAIGAETGVWNWTAVTGMLDVLTLKGNLSQDEKDAIDFFKLTGKLADGLYEYDDAWQKASTSNDPKKEADAFKKLLTTYNDFVTGSMGIGLGVQPAKSVNVISALVKLQGTWTKTDEYGGGAFSFSTPGSENGGSNYEENINNDKDANNNLLPEYPAYNEILGTFALIRKPKVHAHDSSYSVWVTDPVWGTIPEAHLKRTLWLDEDLLYAFNPAAHVDMSKTVVKVAFEIVNTIQLPPGSSSNIHDMDELTNLEATPNTVRYMSPIVPINCFRELVSRYHASIRSDLVNDLQKVRLKFYVELVSSDVGSNGKNNRSTNVYTYPVTIDQTINGNNPKPMGTFQVMNGVGTSATITLSGNIVFPDNNIIYATDKITITSGSVLTGSSNAPAKLIAGNLIDVQSNVTIGPGVDLIISSLPMLCDYTMGAQSHNTVTQFCSGQLQNLTYQAYIHNSKKEDPIDSLWELKKIEDAEKTDAIYYSELYPNPTGTGSTLSLLSPSNQNADISLTNVTGQVVKTISAPLNIFDNKIYIDAGDLAAGVYYVTVKTQNNTLYDTNRLIVIK